MYNKVITLTEFVLEEEQKFPEATGSFTLLVNSISRATKIIASHVKQAGLVDILGQTNTMNSSGDQVKKLDVLSNEIMMETLRGSKQVHMMASEELEETMTVDDKAHYDVFFDPLDGSSNIDVNVNIGTIFSIYRKADSKLQSGNKQIAAGYVLYGPSVMFVYSSGSGVHGFTLDPSMGSFLLSHQNMRVPEEQGIYSFNEVYEPVYTDQTRAYISAIKSGDKKFTSRYIGSLVGDVHRTLVKGGIYGYPADTKRPEGFLRLMYEVNPMTYIIQQAGGLAESNGKNPLDIQPKELHQRVPIILGSKKEVEHYQSFAKK
jgi:fructose-1,6-bisphosphatase I